MKYENFIILFIMLSVSLTLGVHHTASAQISEVRVGISEFDEDITGINWALKFAEETSTGLNAEIIFDEPEFLKPLLSPQPYIGGMLNLEGNTSYARAGILWRQNVGNRFYGDLGLGLAIHNGTTSVPRDSPDLFPRLLEEIEFGSRVLFRVQTTAGVRVTEDWAGELFYEHLSHAGLLNDRLNDGVDIVGARVARRF